MKGPRYVKALPEESVQKHRNEWRSLARWFSKRVLVCLGW